MLVSVQPPRPGIEAGGFGATRNSGPIDPSPASGQVLRAVFHVAYDQDDVNVAVRLGRSELPCSCRCYGTGTAGSGGLGPAWFLALPSFSPAIRARRGCRTRSA